MRTASRLAARRVGRSRAAAVALLGVLAAAACADHGSAPAPAGGGAREFRLAYDEHGALQPAKQDELARLVAATADATDVVVFSHGWWNSPDTAECRYREMIDGLRSRRPAALAEPAFRPVLVGIYWPSALFPPEAGDCAPPESLREAGGPSLRGPALRDRLRAWAQVAFPAAAARPDFPAELERLATLIEREQAGRLAPDEGEALVAILLAWRGAAERGDPPKPRDAPGETTFDLPPGVAAERWRRPPPRQPGGEASGAPEAGAASWLQWANVFTFWTMKDRAGVVGSRGGYDLLRALQPARARGTRIHLVAHSFGGKLLSAALTGHGRGPANQVDSFVILQGAFSHFAFSTAEEIRRLQIATEQPGLYAPVVGGNQVAGPLVATYSLLDVPNRVFYGLGVRASGDMLEADVVSRYGALGADGMQGPPVEQLRLGRDRLGDRYRPGGPRLFNVDGSAVILSHTDFVKPEVFELIWDAIAAARRPSTG